MDSHYTYLLINFCTVIFPVLLSFDRRVQFYKSWKHLLPAISVSGLVFLVWDYVFTVTHVWSFNPDYILGIHFFNLPLEEILFFLTVPFACIFIYECLNSYLKRDIFKTASRYISASLILLSIILGVFFRDRVYTLITFGFLSVLTVYFEFILKSKYLSRIYLAFLVSLIPFYVVNGLLTSIPIVLYNDVQNLGLRVGTIPFEDHFYSLSMLFLNISLFEYFRKRGSSNG